MNKSPAGWLRYTVVGSFGSIKALDANEDANDAGIGSLLPGPVGEPKLRLARSTKVKNIG